MAIADYHYTECGLDNVIIRNANFVSEDHDGEPVWRALVASPGTATPQSGRVGRAGLT